MGYQNLIHDDLHSTEQPIESNLINVQQADALFLSFLGKASSSMGVLFYLVGVLKTDIVSH